MGFGLGEEGGFLCLALRQRLLVYHSGARGALLVKMGKLACRVEGGDSGERCRRTPKAHGLGNTGHFEEKYIQNFLLTVETANVSRESI